MHPLIEQKVQKIFSEQKRLADLSWEIDSPKSDQNQSLQKLIEIEVAQSPVDQQTRVFSELTGFGPLDSVLNDETITEVLVNKFDEIYFEKLGKLERLNDRFFSEQTYNSCLDRLSQMCHSYLNRDKPFLEAQFGTWRVTIVFAELSRGSNLLSIRKQPKKVWTLERFHSEGWATGQQIALINSVFESRKNFLVVGGTGSGKTSFLQALLQQFSPLERAVIIEDTQELHLPNSSCCSLLTRQDPSGSVADVSMEDLLKRALRLRPERLVIGEIRGAEAKSLLMALATGHDGSFGSMHARTAGEALLRLEMLIQMGAPQWSLQSIRQLIAMTLQNIFVVEKINGKRCLQGIYQLSSLENHGFTLEKLD